MNHLAMRYALADPLLSNHEAMTLARAERAKVTQVVPANPALGPLPAALRSPTPRGRRLRGSGHRLRR